MRRFLILMLVGYAIGGLVSCGGTISQADIDRAIADARKKACPQCPTCEDPAPLKAEIARLQQLVTTGETQAAAREELLKVLQAKLDAVKPCEACPPKVECPPATTPDPPAGAYVDEADISGAEWLDTRGENVSAFAITTRLTRLAWSHQGVDIDFPKKNGDGRWPDIVPPGFKGPIQFTFGACFNISGRWRCSAPIEYWHERTDGAGPPEDLAMNWHYDGNRWGILKDHQPQPGEPFLVFVVSGDARGSNWTPSVRERSAVRKLTYPGPEGRTWTW